MIKYLAYTSGAGGTEMDENEHRDTLDTLDYDSLQEQRTDELTDLL